MREHIISDFSPTKDGCGWAVPYAIAFVYPKFQNPIVIKGMSEEVRSYIDKFYPLSFYNITYWKDGRQHGHWTFASGAYGNYVRRDGNRWLFEIFRDKKLVREFSLRRMPHHWIPEFSA